MKAKLNLNLVPLGIAAVTSMMFASAASAQSFGRGGSYNYQNTNNQQQARPFQYDGNDQNYSGQNQTGGDSPYAQPNVVQHVPEYNPAPIAPPSVFIAPVVKPANASRESFSEAARTITTHNGEFVHQYFKTALEEPDSVQVLGSGVRVVLGPVGDGPVGGLPGADNGIVFIPNISSPWDLTQQPMPTFVCGSCVASVVVPHVYPADSNPVAMVSGSGPHTLEDAFGIAAWTPPELVVPSWIPPVAVAPTWEAAAGTPVAVVPTWIPPVAVAPTWEAAAGTPVVVAPPGPRPLPTVDPLPPTPPVAACVMIPIFLPDGYGGTFQSGAISSCSVGASGPADSGDAG